MIKEKIKNFVKKYFNLVEQSKFEVEQSKYENALKILDDTREELKFYKNLEITTGDINKIDNETLKSMVSQGRIVNDTFTLTDIVNNENTNNLYFMTKHMDFIVYFDNKYENKIVIIPCPYNLVDYYAKGQLE